MQHYKIYTMDRAGHIRLAHDVQCESDESALLQGEAEGAPYGVEIWQGSRLVGCINRVQAPQRNGKGA